MTIEGTLEDTLRKIAGRRVPPAQFGAQGMIALGSTADSDKRRGKAVFSRLAASCALVMLACAAVQAQEGPPPGQEDPPPRQEGPPPRQDGPPPRADRCGAVAYTADGAFGAAYGMENCADAESLAIEECRRESTDKADCSRGVVTKTDAWFHIQFCRSSNDWTTHVTTRQTLAEANQAAAQWAQTSKYGAQNCRMVPNGLFHSGGLHTKM